MPRGLHLTSKAVYPEYLGFLRSEKIPYLIEGGKLAGALIRQNLLDEIYILFSPVIIGGYKIATLFRTPDFSIEEFSPDFLEPVESRTLNNKLLVHYKVLSNK